MKENFDSNSFEENDMKRMLYEQLKKGGILDGLKSQLRSKLYDQLKMKNEKRSPYLRDQSNQLSFKMCASLITDFM